MNFLQKNRPWIILTFAVLVLFGGFLVWRNRSIHQTETTSAPATLVNGRLEQPVTEKGKTYWLPPSELFESGLSTQDVPAIDAPKFISASEADAAIGDDLYGIDVALNGEHRFYPVQILNWHQVVNDDWQGTQFSVTFDPLTFSSAVYDRHVADKTLTFEYSGKLFSNGTILRDRETGTQWLQLNGKGVTEDTALTRIPSTFMKWGVWKSAYANGTVLSSETGVSRDYSRHPYGAYDTSETIYFPIARPDTKLGTKWLVDGFGDVAFSWKILEGKGALNETTQGTPVVALYDFDLKTVRVFSRAVANATSDLTFTYDFKNKELKDDQTGSAWSADGKAISGSLAGTQLSRVESHTCYWFAWSNLYSGTRVAGTESVSTPTTK